MVDELLPDRMAGQTIEAEPGGFFKLAEPLLTIAKRQFQNDLDNLKDLTEAHAL